MSSEDLLTHNSTDQAARPSDDTIGDAHIDLHRASPHVSSYAEVDARRDVTTAFGHEAVVFSELLEIRLHAQHVSRIRRQHLENDLNSMQSESERDTA
jgi:hypothetical protein